jgi:hypothetical protein
MCGKILSILLALIVVALSASGAVACTDNNVDACGSCDNIGDTCGACGTGIGECDTGIGACGTGVGTCGTGVGTCGDVFFGTCGNDVGKCGNVFFGTLGNDVGKCGNDVGTCDAFSKEANVPTWEELVLALQHNGFESWSGINFSGFSNL